MFGSGYVIACSEQTDVGYLKATEHSSSYNFLVPSVWVYIFHVGWIQETYLSAVTPH